MEMKERWAKFRRGDALSKQELEALIMECQTGISWLEARGETGGVLFKARIDLETLLSFQHFRARKT